MIMLELGKVEDEIFRTRQQKEVAFKAREKAKKRRSDGFNEYKPNFGLLNNTQFAPRVCFCCDFFDQVQENSLISGYWTTKLSG